MYRHTYQPVYLDEVAFVPPLQIDEPRRRLVGDSGSVPPPPLRRSSRHPKPSDPSPTHSRSASPAGGSSSNGSKHPKDCSCLAHPFFRMLVRESVEEALDDIRKREDQNTTRMLGKACGVSVTVLVLWALVKLIQSV